MAVAGAASASSRACHETIGKPRPSSPLLAWIVLALRARRPSRGGTMPCRRKLASERLRWLVAKKVRVPHDVAGLENAAHLAKVVVPAFGRRCVNSDVDQMTSNVSFSKGKAYSSS